MKQNNQQKEQKIQLANYGKKIRDININHRQHFIAVLVSIILLGILTLAMGIMFMVFIKKWYVVLIVCLVFAACTVWAVFTMKNLKKQPIYQLYERVLVINSLQYQTVIDLANVYAALPKNSTQNKSERNVGRIKLFVKTKFVERPVLNHINEDEIALSNEILALAEKARQKKHQQQTSANLLVKMAEKGNNSANKNSAEKTGENEDNNKK